MSFVDRLSRWLVQRRRGLLVCALLLTAFGYPASRRLTFDQSIESLFAASNPRLVEFQNSRRAFGADDFVVVAYRDPLLFDAEDNLTETAQDRIYDLKKRIAAVPGIEPGSLQTLSDVLRAPYAQQRLREFATGLLVGENGQTTAVIARLQSADNAKVPRSETFQQVRQIAAKHDPPAIVVGEPIQVHDMFRYVEEDGTTLGWWSTILLMLVIFVLFRSLRWMILPLAVVQIVLVWTRALLVVSHMQLSMVSSMLNSLTTIIGIATGMHLTLRYRELSATLDREAALTQALRELIRPVFWTIATTAAGFAVLLSSHIAPVASFGIMMALATLLVLVAGGMVFPGGVLLGPQTSVPGIAPGEGWITRQLAALANFVERRPKSVSMVMVAVSSFCLYGLFHLQLETDFSKNFRAQSPIVQALSFFEDNLGGSGTWEVNFPAPDVLTEDYLDKVAALSEDLRTLTQRKSRDRLTKVIVIHDGLDLIPANLLFTRISLETRMNLLGAIQPDFVPSLYNPEAKRMRIMLRSLERQPSESKLGLIADVEAIARRHFPEAEATGLFVLLAYLIESLMADQLTSTLLAAAAIVTLMSLAERSLPLGLALLVPNAFPIVLVIGSMGWLGMKVNIASAMIASVSMGLTIDSSIHYLAGYRRWRERGLSVSEALHRTHQETGLALVCANLALVAGFSVLTLSHFIPLVYFGVLVSVAMIGGLVGNLVLLPLLIRVADHRHFAKRQSDGHLG